MNNIYGIDTDTPRMRRMAEAGREYNLLTGELRSAITAARRRPSAEADALVADLQRRRRNADARYRRALNSGADR